MSVDTEVESIKIDLTDNERRHTVVGIALNNYLVPQIKPFVDQQMKQYYEELKTEYKIHTAGDSKLTWDVAKKLGLNIHEWNINVLRKIKSHNQLAKHYQKYNMVNSYKSILDEGTDATAILSMLTRSQKFSEDIRKGSLQNSTLDSQKIS